MTLRALRFSTALGLAAMVAAGPLLAKDQAGRYFVEGAGQITCEDYLGYTQSQGPELGQIAAWLNGYLTAHNKLQDGTFDKTPWQTIEVLVYQLQQFCNANKDARFERGAAELMTFLEPNRITEYEELAPVANGENTVYLYESVIQRVRDALGKTGIDVAPTENGLSDAIRAFQATDARLPQDGLPDQNTLLQLFAKADAAE